MAQITDADIKARVRAFRTEMLNEIDKGHDDSNADAALTMKLALLLMASGSSLLEKLHGRKVLNETLTGFVRGNGGS